MSRFNIHSFQYLFSRVVYFRIIFNWFFYFLVFTSPHLITIRYRLHENAYYWTVGLLSDVMASPYHWRFSHFLVLALRVFNMLLTIYKSINSKCTGANLPKSSWICGTPRSWLISNTLYGSSSSVSGSTALSTVSYILVGIGNLNSWAASAWTV